jgi:hypothetical protein
MGKPLSKVKKELKPHMWVISKDSAGGYIVTMGSPKKPGSRIKVRFSGDGAKAELKYWVKYDMPKQLSEDHIIDMSGLKLIPEFYTQWYVDNATVADTLDEVAEMLQARGELELEHEVSLVNEGLTLIEAAEDPVKFGMGELKVRSLVSMHPSQFSSVWEVVKALPKQITVISQGTGNDPGPRFAGKRYTYKWDGTGYKRQGQYLVHPKK